MASVWAGQSARHVLYTAEALLLSTLSPGAAGTCVSAVSKVDCQVENAISWKGMIFKKETLIRNMKGRWEIRVKSHQADKKDRNNDSKLPLPPFPPFRPKPMKWVNLERVLQKLSTRQKQNNISTIPPPIFYTWRLSSLLYISDNEAICNSRFISSRLITPNSVLQMFRGKWKMQNSTHEYWASLCGSLY